MKYFMNDHKIDYKSNFDATQANSAADFISNLTVDDYFLKMMMRVD